MLFQASRFPAIPMAIWSFPIHFFHKKRLDINNSHCLPSGDGVEKSEGLHQQTVQPGQRWLALQLGAGLGWIQTHQVQFGLICGRSMADCLPEQQVQYGSVRCWVCAGGQAGSNISSGFRQTRKNIPFPLRCGSSTLLTTIIPSLGKPGPYINFFGMRIRKRLVWIIREESYLLTIVKV